ncbi:putative Phytocyanin domain-containing protein [Helianthus annuus]|nr:putative Phytocyanin domain-containing protein [Helianthus annuus]
MKASKKFETINNSGRMSSSPLYNSINRWFIAMTNIIQTHTFLKITLFFQEYKIMAKVSIMRVLIGLAAMVMLLQVVVATDYTVGSPSGGWDTTTDLGSWSSSQTFTVGDNLGNEFIYVSCLEHALPI